VIQENYNKADEDSCKQYNNYKEHPFPFVRHILTPPFNRFLDRLLTLLAKRIIHRAST
jgi:hypothetical protein